MLLLSTHKKRIIKGIVHVCTQTVNNGSKTTVSIANSHSNNNKLLAKKNTQFTILYKGTAATNRPLPQLKES